MTEPLVFRAYAKINLHLRVGQLDRDSGYHALETLFQTIDLYDELTFSRDANISLRGDLQGAPTDGTNLILRAAHLLREEEGCSEGAAITLRKAIPMQAGLAGGSTDCAATLVGLNQLWELGLTIDQIRRYASTLGADVPFVVSGGAALGTGRGERLEFFASPSPRRWIVLVVSNTGVSTQEAFAALTPQDRAADVTLGNPEPSAALRDMGAAWSSGQVPEQTVNTFEPGIFRSRPRLAELLTALRDLGAELAHLSGTGPSLYGVFPTEARARAAEQGLALQEGERAIVTCTVEASPVLQS